MNILSHETQSNAVLFIKSPEVNISLLLVHPVHGLHDAQTVNVAIYALCSPLSLIAR